MGAEVGIFRAFYESPVQHPWLLWGAAALALAACLARRDLDPGLRRYLVLLVGVSALDAWLTSSHVCGIGALSGPAAWGVPLFFVLAGDFRYWLIVTGARADGVFAPGVRAIVRAAALTAAVPLFTQLAMELVPGSPRPARWTFLVYELAFATFALALLRWHPALRQGWIRSLTLFVLATYALWAGADLLLLATGADAGHLLRVLPNLLYYGGFVAAAALLAPGAPARERRVGGREPRAWTPLETELLQDCAVFQVSRVDTRSPGGSVHRFYRIDSADWINVVALTPRGDLVMVRQFRHGSGEVTLEIPGGLVDPGETPAEAAARELLEETGYRARRLERIGAVNPNPALFGNRVHTFLARDVERVAEVANDGTEETSVEIVPRADLPRLIREGAIDHALVVAGLFHFELSG